MMPLASHGVLCASARRAHARWMRCKLALSKGGRCIPGAGWSVQAARTRGDLISDAK